MLKGKRFILLIALSLLLGLVMVPVAAQDAQVVKIYTSWPLTGGSQFTGESMVNAANLAIMHYMEDNEGMGPGGVTIELVALDDASPQTGAWDATIEAENAQRCVNDAECLVYFGTYNSGAAKVSMVITNEAGIAQISPANSYPGLTRSCPTCEEGEPGIYRPSESVNYFRVTATDDVQGPAAASWAYCLGYDSVYVLDDAQTYGAGIANEFAVHAEEIGLTVAGRGQVESTSIDFRALLTDVLASEAEMVFGGFVLDSGGPQVIQQMAELGLFEEGIAFMGPDGVLSPALIDQVGGAEILNGNTYFTFPALLPQLLTNEAGVRFYEGYVAEFGEDTLDPYAVYAYQAMEVILLSIERAAADGGEITRETVLAQMGAGEPFDSVLGEFSFDENGDNTVAGFFGYSFAEDFFADPVTITAEMHATCERAE